MCGRPYLYLDKQAFCQCKLSSCTDFRCAVQREAGVDTRRPSQRDRGFAEFATPLEAEAALSKHRQMLGSRYIELFMSTPEEVARMAG